MPTSIRATIDQQTGFFPIPTGDVKEITPVTQAYQTGADIPDLPKAAVVDKIYQNVRQAMASRDYELLVKSISSDLIWNLEHESKIIGETKEGAVVSELTNISGEESFNTTGVYGLGFLAPPIDEIEPSTVEWFQSPPEPDAKTYYINRETQETLVVKPINWSYKVALNYKLRSGSLSGSGRVFFVYDNGIWKYNLEDWNVKRLGKPRELGDPRQLATANKTVKVDKTSGGCNPAQVEIKTGETVRWEGIVGKIYSVPPTTDHWLSDYMYEDNFTRGFSKAGTYTYRIVGPHVVDYKAVNCKIVVR